jgi:hypothetical protein
LLIPASLAHVAIRMRQTQGEEHSAPKTVLGFYATVLAILEVGVVGAVAVLASQKELRYLIPWVLGFGAIVLVILIGIVVAINVRAPMKLQLGQVTGRELIEYEHMTLGDSLSGEYVAEVPIRPNIDPPQRGELSESAVDDQEGGT